MTGEANSKLRFVFCASGICFCYWLYGAMQESLISNTQLGATFLLVLQTIANVLISLVWGSASREESDKNSIFDLQHKLLFVTSSTYVFAMVCSNEALRYVSYPTAVLAKSCKMIPTMVMGFLVERRSYSFQQWAAAFLISTGIASFNLLRFQDKQVDTEEGNDGSDQYWKGMWLLCASLCLDGFLGSFQGMLKSGERPPTANETMFCVNCYAFTLMLPMSIFSGQFSEGIQLLKDDVRLVSIVLLQNAIVAVGQIFIFLTITWYSSLVCTTITTTRKFFTILFSVVYFGHRFNIWQWVSVCMVFGGLYLSIVYRGGHETAVEKRKKTD